MVGWEQQPGNSINLCVICKSGIFNNNVAMTEIGILLDQTVAFPVMPNEDFGSNGRVSFSIFGLLGYLR